MSKQKYVKVTAIGKEPDGEEVEWFAVGSSRRETKELADRMGMPTDNRTYVDIFLTPEQYEAIPEWD